MKVEEIEQRIKDEFKKRTGYEVYDDLIVNYSKGSSITVCIVKLESKEIRLDISGVRMLADCIMMSGYKSDKKINEKISRATECLIEFSGLDSKYEI
jgi:hypothetical protein